MCNSEPHRVLEDPQGRDETLHAEEVVPVRRDVDAVNHALRLPSGGGLALLLLDHLPLGGHVIELQAELEADVLEGVRIQLVVVERNLEPIK